MCPICHSALSGLDFVTTELRTDRTDSAQLLMVQAHQSSRVVNKATPRFVQCAADMFDCNRTSMTKFVLCPVVLKIPRRSLVLYIGQR